MNKKEYVIYSVAVTTRFKKQNSNKIESNQNSNR